MSYKSVPQEFPTRVAHKSVLQSVPQECPTRVCFGHISFSIVFAFGFVGSILFFQRLSVIWQALAMHLRKARYFQAISKLVESGKNCAASRGKHLLHVFWRKQVFGYCAEFCRGLACVTSYEDMSTSSSCSLEFWLKQLSPPCFPQYVDSRGRR